MTDELTARPPVLAAGGVPMRQLDGRTQLLLIHRPRHDDWTLPKGHIEPGEHPLVAAVREVNEETGLAVRLGPPLPALAYPLPTTGRSWSGSGRRYRSKGIPTCPERST